MGLGAAPYLVEARGIAPVSRAGTKRLGALPVPML